jgi:regulator of RNase E activity RraB
MADSVADQVAAHAARNRKLVALIVKKGADRTARRAIDLHFWAPDELSARRLADALREVGVDKVASNQTEADPSLWNVEGEISASVDDVVADAFVERFVTLAAAHGADFDGWGTAL